MKQNHRTYLNNERDSDDEYSDEENYGIELKESLKKGPKDLISASEMSSSTAQSQMKPSVGTITQESETQSYESKAFRGMSQAKMESLVFFDSVAIEFALGRFLHQLLVHLFPPFFNWSVNAQGHGFMSMTFISVLTSVLQPFVFYTMIITAFLSKDSIVRDQGALTMPVLYYILHKVVVATKYACLSPTEYIRFQTASKRYGQRYRKQMELVSGWLNRNPIVLDFEMGAAIVRIGLRPLTKLDVRISHYNKADSIEGRALPDGLRQWRDFLRCADDASSDNSFSDSASKSSEASRSPNQSTESNKKTQVDAISIQYREDGSYVSIFDVCTAIVKHSDDQDYYFSFFDKGCISLSGKSSKPRITASNGL